MYARVVIFLIQTNLMLFFRLMKSYLLTMSLVWSPTVDNLNKCDTYFNAEKYMIIFIEKRQ